MAQHTLRAPIHCTGIGVHSNRRITMRLLPAEADQGIVFVRSDLGSRDGSVRAHHSNVVDTRLCTALGRDGQVLVGTVEHLMAALGGLGVDNATVEIDGPEVPIMDGSAAPFVFLVECAGMLAQSAPRRAIEVLREVSVRSGDKWARIAPAASLGLRCEIDFGASLIGRQSLEVTMAPGVFKRELAHARTFCLEEDVRQMRALGLGKGGSLDNAVVVGLEGVLNPEGLRCEDEFVRHKALDLLGDLCLAGAPILGHVSAARGGHALNHALLTALMADTRAWRYVSPGEEADESEPLALAATA